MWMIPDSVRIFVATVPIDLRKSYDSLSILAESVLGHDPLSGHLFVFFNRSRNRVKVLWWHRGGYNLFCRRLERGRFGPAGTPLSGVELAMVLEGIDLRTTRKRARWAPR